MMKKEKRRRELMFRWGIPAMALTALLAGVGIGFGAGAFSDGQEENAPEVQARNGGELTAGEDSGEDIPGDDSAENTESIPEGTVPEEVPKLKGNSRLGWLPEPEEAVPAGGEADNPEDVLPASNPLAIGSEPFAAQETPDTAVFDETIISEYGVFIDVETGTVLAQKEARTRMNPASMTKILTVLVAAEHLTEADLDETVTITIDITDYCYTNECSITGYEVDETVPVRDLFYGTILPSGADSALALAEYVAGSHEAFVDLMNQKLEQMGLAETSHFTNCVGLYDEEHYTTAYDMAVMLKAAADNPFCRDILSAHTYATASTAQHPEGMLISNWFLRRIEDRDTHGEVLCGKTGFVDQSGSCAASLGTDYEGKEYLCVTAASQGSWRCIADQVELYQRFLPEAETESTEQTEGNGTETEQNGN